MLPSLDDEADEPLSWPAPGEVTFFSSGPSAEPTATGKLPTFRQYNLHAGRHEREALRTLGFYVQLGEIDIGPGNGISKTLHPRKPAGCCGWLITRATSHRVRRQPTTFRARILGSGRRVRLAAARSSEGLLKRSTGMRSGRPLCIC